MQPDVVTLMKWWCVTMSNSGLNQKAWEILFKRHNILEKVEKDGVCYISAKQIKKEREPRLMAKFDHSINLPPIFAQNKLSILPITRGDYAIAHFDSYHSFEPISSEINQVTMPSYIQSINSSDIPSESIALNCAIATGIIADFTGDIDIIPTVSGRMGSGNFDFIIKDTCNEKQLSVKVKNSQIEIDAAYEGVNYLSLIEAKRDLSDDFLVRQLYYPYRVWQSRVTKPVKPIFLVYSNGIYHLYEYAFVNPNEYSSLQLVKQKNYAIEDTEITIEDIIQVLEQVEIVNEPQGVPFPQADSFKRVINLCELVDSDNYTRERITLNYDFDIRQTSYYVSAAVYLGLIEQPSRHPQEIIKLTIYGKAVMQMNYKQRQLAYCKQILSHKVFNHITRLYFERGEMPEKSVIVDIMKHSNLYNVDAESTYIRRASTISSWVDWIASLI